MNFRPQNWAEYFGQHKIIDTLKIYVQAAKLKKQPLEHLLFSGVSGSGKTSLAYLLSRVLDCKLHYLNGPNIQKPSDLVSVLSFLQPNDIFFIDEVHAVSKEILEILYPVLENNKLSIIFGKEYNSKIIDLTLPKFTLIAATNELNKLATPFIHRFSIHFEFSGYNLQEIQVLLEHHAQKLQLTLDASTTLFFAGHCRKNPRIAINLLKRVADFALIKNRVVLDTKFLQTVFQALEIFHCGLTKQDLRYLKILTEYEVLGLNSLAQYLDLPVLHIQQFIEPLLLNFRFILKTTRGRRLTQQGRDYLRQIKQFVDWQQL